MNLQIVIGIVVIGLGMIAMLLGFSQKELTIQERKQIFWEENWITNNQITYEGKQIYVPLVHALPSGKTSGQMLMLDGVKGIFLAIKGEWQHIDLPYEFTSTDKL